MLSFVYIYALNGVALPDRVTCGCLGELWNALHREVDVDVAMENSTAVSVISIAFWLQFSSPFLLCIASFSILFVKHIYNKQAPHCHSSSVLLLQTKHQIGLKGNTAPRSSLIRPCSYKIIQHQNYIPLHLYSKLNMLWRPCTGQLGHAGCTTYPMYKARALAKTKHKKHNKGEIISLLASS